MHDCPLDDCPTSTPSNTPSWWDSHAWTTSGSNRRKVLKVCQEQEDCSYTYRWKPEGGSNDWIHVLDIVLRHAGQGFLWNLNLRQPWSKVSSIISASCSKKWPWVIMRCQLVCSLNIQIWSRISRNDWYGNLVNHKWDGWQVRREKKKPWMWFISYRIVSEDDLNKFGH